MGFWIKVLGLRIRELYVSYIMLYRVLKREWKRTWKLVYYLGFRVEVIGAEWGAGD